jgi:DNA polymerase-3 subunit delta
MDKEFNALLRILYGKDDFSTYYALEDIKREICDPEALAINTCILDGKQLSLKQLEDACNVFPSLLCPSRLIIVENLLGRFEYQRKKKRRISDLEEKGSRDLEEWLNLVQYIKLIPETTELVLIDEELNFKNRLLKALSPLAKVKRFPGLKDNELRAWIAKRLKDRDGTITSSAIDKLVSLVGSDLWAMSSEVDKLLEYSLERRITEDDVKQAGSYAREADIFTLVDAIIEGRREIAQQCLQQLLQSGAGPQYILTMITRQLRLITVAKEMGEDIFHPEIRSKLDKVNDFSLRKALIQTKAYTWEKIFAAYHKLIDTDIDIKTGKYDDELALGLLVIDLCKR